MDYGKTLTSASPGLSGRRHGPGKIAFTLLLFLVLASAGCAPAPSRLTTGPLVEFSYYYGSNCHLCQEFLNNTVPALERKTGIRLSVLTRDVLEPANLKEYKTRTKALGVQAVDLPSVIIGDTVLQGKTAIDQRLEAEIKNALAAAPPEAAAQNNGTTGDASGADAIGAESLAFIPVLLAGLVDGINPCVFSTLIFLLAYLTYAGKTRKQLLLIGIFYTLAVFVTYFLLGLGFSRIIQALSFFSTISLIINIILIGVLFLFAGLSIFDAVMVHRGNMDKIKLQLPEFFKNRIRKTIRSQAASAAIIASALGLGFLVSIFELACTGQIYLPTITALVQTRKNISDFAYLAVYNGGFIVPLLIVFALTYTGLSSQKLTGFFQKHMKIVKILIAILFFVAAVFMLVYTFGQYILS